MPISRDAPPPGTNRPPSTNGTPSRHVQYPVDFPLMSDAATWVWVLIRWHSKGADKVVVSQAQLQADLGRAGSTAGNLGPVLRELEDAKLIETTRKHIRGADGELRTQNEYTSTSHARPDDGRPWVDVSATMLADLRAGVLRVSDAALIRWLVRLRQESNWTVERGGHTGTSLASLAAEWGEDVRTVRRHRSRLIALGWLEEQQRHGRAPLTGIPGSLPAVAQIVRADPTPDKNPQSPRTLTLNDPGQNPAVTPDKKPHQELPTPLTELQTEELPKIKTPSSVAVATDVTAVPREAGPSAPPKRKDLHRANPRRLGRSAPISAEALAVVARLPREWRPADRQWVVRRVAAQVDRALALFGADAIVAAVTRYAPGADLVDYGAGTLLPVGDGGRQTHAMRAALAQLIADVKAGACSRCAGDDHPTADHGKPAAWLGSPPEVCVVCDGPDAVPRLELPLKSAVCDGCWAPVAVAA